MADAAVAVPGSLGDFFAKKKKKVKACNLNSDGKLSEQQQKAAKDAAEDKDEEVAEKVQVVGKLTREDEKKEEDQHSAPAWRTKNTESKKDLDERKYPTLKSAVGQSSNINIDDGSNTHLNIKTSKNLFQALHDDDSDEEDGAGKRPQEIKACQVTKQKGEMLSTVIKREVDKYGGQKGGASAAAAPEKKKKKKKGKDAESSEEEFSEDEEEKEVRLKKEAKAAKQAAKAGLEPEEDEKIQPDLKESRRKYQGREKLPAKKLPESELQAEKENKPGKAQNATAAGGKKGKKNANALWAAEETKPKLQAAPEGW